jgi:hypothetical protein
MEPPTKMSDTQCLWALSRDAATGAGQCVGRDGHRNVISILVSKHSCHGERGGRMTGREGIAAFPKTAVVIMARRSSHGW